MKSGGKLLLNGHGQAFGPKTINQQNLVAAFAKYDVVFAIGPAGTGKTYTSIALALRALQERQVKRIVITRPAIEAGESLGFLPGDLQEKLDPYLQPIYDAFIELCGKQKLDAWLEDGTIQIVPLAFMRGRAQPLNSSILTPQGWILMGQLRPGDQVIGSNGAPTTVTGIFPQGRKDTYEVEFTDGSRTRCSADHLWTVYTPSDRRHGTGPRVLELREIAENLHAGHQYRYEIPVLSEPVQFDRQAITVDPYALGALIGDGCLRHSTPTFCTADTEMAELLDERLPDVSVRHKKGYDYTLVRCTPTQGEGNRNPLTTALKDLGLHGKLANDKYVPSHYLFNDVETRLELLRGLMDTDGSVYQSRDRARLEFVSTSERLAQDVVFLVQSLGGIARLRRRSAESKGVGLANGRPVPHRTDSFSVTFNLPVGIIPFKLTRKVERFLELGGTSPTQRRIKSVTLVGEDEMQCISVDAMDSLYVTDACILTHNTLKHSLVIADEMQNATYSQLKMLLTRLGTKSKMIINGDASQTDLPSRRHSALYSAYAIFERVRGVKFVFLDGTDVVRHELVADIIAAYDDFEVDEDLEPEEAWEQD